MRSRAERLDGSLVWDVFIAALEKLQAGRCGCCGRDFGNDSCLDHDHVSGFIRGLLCRSCNSKEGTHRGCGIPTGQCPICLWRERPAVAALGMTILFSGVRDDCEPRYPDWEPCAVTTEATTRSVARWLASDFGLPPADPDDCPVFGIARPEGVVS